MGREAILLKSEEKRSRGEIAGFLHRVAAKIEQGSLTMKHGGESIEIDFPEIMTLEVKVEEETSRTGKRSLEIELEWNVGDLEQDALVIG